MGGDIKEFLTVMGKASIAISVISLTLQLVSRKVLNVI